MPKLTKEIIDKATPRAAPYWDSDLSGFALRVGKNGAKTFIVRYRPKGTGRSGPKKYYTIGRYGPLTPAEARNKARQLLGEVAGGADPAAELAVARSAITVAELVERYLQDEVAPKRKPGTASLYGIHLRKHVLPDLGSLKAENVTRAIVAKLHVKIGKTHAVTANRVKATLSGMFAFGIARALLPADMINPAKGIERFRETSRERFLSAVELESLGGAIREAETIGIPWQVDNSGPNAKHLMPKERRLTVLSPFATAAIRLLLFTGCRLREILEPRMERSRFRPGDAASSGFEDGQEKRRSELPCPGNSDRPAPPWRFRDRRRRSDAAAVGPQAPLDAGFPSRWAGWPSPPRLAPQLRQRRRWSGPRLASDRQAARARVAVDHGQVCAPRQRSRATGDQRHRRDDRRCNGSEGRGRKCSPVEAPRWMTRVLLTSIREPSASLSAAREFALINS